MRAVPGWMCNIDWTWELGEAAGGNKVYASEEDCRRCRKCCSVESEDHFPKEVVVMSREDFDALWATSSIHPDELHSSNVGPIFWSKDRPKNGQEG